MPIKLAVSLVAALLVQGEKDDWITFRPTNGEFQVQLPGQPLHQPRTLRPSPESELTIHTYTVRLNGGKLAMVVGFHDLKSKPENDAQIESILDAGSQGAAMNLGTKIDRQESLKLGQHPGRHFEYAGRLGDKQFKAVARIYVVDRRVIHLTVMGQAEEIDPQIVEKFFGSLKLGDDQQAAAQRR